MFKNLNPAALGVSGHSSEIIELALTFGFAGIDVNMSEFAAQVRLKGIAYAKRLIQSAKLQVGTFALTLDWDAEDEAFQKELKKLPEYTEYAKELGCTRCTTLLAPASDTRPYHENFEVHRRRLHDVCAVLKPAGLRLAVGFRSAESLRRDRAFQFIYQLDALLLLLNMVAAPNLGLLVDTWEIVASGGSLDAIEKLPGEQIIAVQVADMPTDVALADLDEKSRLLPGGEQGRIDVAGFLAALRQAGYEGPVTAKPSKAVLPSRRDLAIKQIAQALDRVMKPGAAKPQAV